MTKVFFFIIGLTVSLTLSAQSPNGAQKLKKLSEHVYAYVGIENASPVANSFGANVGVVIGEDAVLVIDTLVSAKQAEKLIADIKKITDKPIKYVVNTHYHADHTWGNSEFAKEGAVIIGHGNIPATKETIAQSMRHASVYGLKKEDMIGTEAKRPDILIEKECEVDLGGVCVTLKYPGHAHAADNIMAMVEGDDVLFVGDIVFNKYHPFLGEGNFENWEKILKELSRTNAKIMIPGHGPRFNKKDIVEMAEYLQVFDAEAKTLAKGKTRADAKALAKKLLEKLPKQSRNELEVLIEMNMKTRYLRDKQ